MKESWLIDNFGESWFNKLKDYLLSEEFNELGKSIALERKSKAIYPSSDKVFRCFRETPFNNVKIVILALDPYHDGSADGLAFSNSGKNLLNSKMSPSLSIIYDTIERTVYKGLMLDKDPSLERWAKQGVLLLNSALTVEKGIPKSHLVKWKPFTKQVFKALNDYNTGVIYCLWGKDAQEFEKYINPKFNYILKCPHPVSAAYNKTIWDCSHFNEINKILKDNNNDKIIW